MQGEEADAAFLWHMLGAARLLIERLRGLDYEDYLEDLDAQAFAERRLEIIGEAARRVSRSFWSANSDIPWRRIVGQRNIIAHFYYGVDQEKVWESVTVGIPDLITKLEQLLPAPPPDPEPGG